MIDFFFIAAFIGYGYDWNKIFLVSLFILYIVFVYISGYTIGGLLTRQKIYWKNKKDFVSFIERTIAAIIYNFFIFPYKFSEIEYSLNGEFSYDLEFGTYVSEHKEYKSEYKLTKIKSFAFYLKWFAIYFFILIFLVNILNFFIGK